MFNVSPRALAARGESLAAFDRRCIPPRGIARRSNTPGMLPPRAWQDGRLGGLGATRDFHHGLIARFILLTSGGILILAIGLGCVAGGSEPPDSAPLAQAAPDWDAQRRRMVETQLRARDITAPAVLSAMGRVPRHLFVPERARALAYDDHPLPIGSDQTISQPYIVAYMTQLLELPPDAKVLEIGTGSGYQAAVLSEVADEVYTIEIVEALAARAAADLAALGYDNVTAKAGDGYVGWPEHAPFDGIMVTAAPDHVPQPLVEQLAVGARLVLPVGRDFQVMTVLTKTEDGVIEEQTIPVRFVPMTGRARVPRDP